jgi:hypothetical protein
LYSELVEKIMLSVPAWSPSFIRAYRIKELIAAKVQHLDAKPSDDAYVVPLVILLDIARAIRAHVHLPAQDTPCQVEVVYLPGRSAAAAGVPLPTLLAIVRHALNPSRTPPQRK